MGCGLVSNARAATQPDLPRRARHSRDEKVTCQNEHHADFISFHGETNMQENKLNET